MKGNQGKMNIIDIYNKYHLPKTNAHVKSGSMQ